MTDPSTADIFKFSTMVVGFLISPDNHLNYILRFILRYMLILNCGIFLLSIIFIIV